MVSINYASREVTCKIVYYGPGLSGKTTNLIYVHKKVPATTKGKMISLATEADRTLYFDFLPINIGDVNGFTAKFQLYTVPGQVYYNATRKLVLRGVDGIVFVADSQSDKMDENIESLTDMKENLAEYGYDYHDLPIVIQYNKRDLSNILPVAELESKLNTDGWKSFEAEAVNGAGVFDTLKMIIKLVLAKAQSTSARSRDRKAVASAAPPAEVAESVAPPVEETTAPTTPEPSPAATPPQAESPPVEPVPSEKVESEGDREEIEEVPGLVRHSAYQDRTEKAPEPEATPIEPAPDSRDTQEAPADREPVAVTESDQPAARPFPGSSTGRIMRRERRITVSDFQPASRDQEDEALAGRLAEEQKRQETVESEMPTPTMAPSARKMKKKRGFFKRLFGIK